MKRVSGAELSALTGRSWQTIKRLLNAAGVFPLERVKTADLFHSEEALKVIYARPGQEEGLDLNHEKARLAAEQADLTALKAAGMRGELAPVALLEQALGRAAAQAAAILEGIPGMLKRRLPHLGQTELDLIRKETARAANAIADARLELEAQPTGDGEDHAPQRRRAGSLTRARAA